MWVKGSGGETSAPSPRGPGRAAPGPDARARRRLPGVEREDEMVAAFDYCLHGKGGAAPSIDTAMHGLVDAAHSRPPTPTPASRSPPPPTRGADAEGLRREGGVGGRGAARLPARSRHRRDQGAPPAGGRLHPGRPRDHRVGRRHLGGVRAQLLWIIDTAAAYIAEHSRPEPFGPALDGYGALDEPKRRARAAALAPPSAAIAGADRPMVGHFTDSPEVLDFLAAREHPRLAALGTSCPDHFLRTRSSRSCSTCRRRLGRGLPDAAARAGRRLPRGLPGLLRPPRHRGLARDPRQGPADRPGAGVGMFSFGKDKQPPASPASSTSTPSYVMRGAEGLSTYARSTRREVSASSTGRSRSQAAADAAAQAARHPRRPRDRRRLGHRPRDRAGSSPPRARASSSPTSPREGPGLGRRDRQHTTSPSGCAWTLRRRRGAGDGRLRGARVRRCRPWSSTTPGCRCRASLLETRGRQGPAARRHGQGLLPRRAWPRRRR